MPVANENTHTHTHKTEPWHSTPLISVYNIYHQLQKRCCEHRRPQFQQTILRANLMLHPAIWNARLFAVPLCRNQSPFGTYNAAYSRKCYKWGSGPSRHLALDLPVHVHKELDIGEDVRCLVLYQK